MMGQEGYVARVDLCGKWELGHRPQPPAGPAQPEEAFGPLALEPIARLEGAFDAAAVAR